MSKRSIRLILFAATAVACLTALGGPGAFACGVLEVPATTTSPAATSAPAPEVVAASIAESECVEMLAVNDPLIAAGGSSCCDPAKEPGTGGNPFCFEGHSCCANGQWACNNHDATPSCTVCGSSCSPSGATCTSNANCCSGTCKKTGRCR